MESFSLNPSTELSSVAIKVKDFEKMVGFYQRIVGLDILSEENDMAMMGIGNKKKKLIGLIATPDGKEGTNNHTGLYHTTFVFPTRDDLARFMKHLMLMNYPIEGKSDHGYCESIYINDPENNRLEFSWDKPKDVWPLTNGRIDGVTKELDIQSLLSEVEDDYQHIPETTRMGHVHLSVIDLETSYDFYVKKLGFKVKDDDFVHTHFLSVSDYHHQIALNDWTPTTVSPIQSSDLGVDHITFNVPEMSDLLHLKEHLEEGNSQFYFNKGKRIIGITDPSGIQLWFIATNK